MPLNETSGNVTSDAYGGGVAAKVNYIEDCFVAWLSTGNGTSRTVTGPDMTTGGLSITKSRSAATGWHFVDTARGAGNSLSSNSTAASASESTGVTAFTTTGTSIGAAAEYNTSGATYVDYLLKKQPKLFDVVTYTGNESAPRAISHSLGSTPGCIMIKKTSATGDWWVFHRSAPNQGAAYPNIGGNLYLNYTDAADSGTNPFLSAVSSTTFTLSTNQNTAMNASGATYVAYIFAHNAGGFGLTGTDNVISCGSFTTDASSNATVNLGYEPQWVLIKNSQVAANWVLIDNMRGWANSSAADPKLNPNNSDSEDTTGQNCGHPTATGFTVSQFAASNTHIYIAIRRGPMKVPTDATKVFAPIAYNGTNTAGQVISGVGFSPDLTIPKYRAGAGGGAVAQFIDRLRGGTAYLAPSSTGAEGNTGGYYVRSFDMDGTTFGTAYVDYTYSGNTYVDWFFKRAPSFFDEVCYTGTGSNTTQTHNLGAVPELMIVKARSVGGSNWTTYSSTLGNTQALFLNLTNTPTTASNIWNNTSPTSSVFSIGTSGSVNTSGTTYVAYLFATCAGVSKVGSYTGNGTTQAIACGFAGGARFVLIKRTDSTGDWYVYDTSRGMTTLTDPYLLLNSTAAESATLGSVTTTTGGFTVNASILAAINTNGASYLFLAIA